MKAIRQLVCTISVIGILLVSSCALNHLDIREEAYDISDYLLENVSGDDIYLSEVYWDETGITIELYGSNSIDVILDLQKLSNTWLEDHPDSLVESNQLRFSIELFESRPDTSDRERFAYCARIGNYEPYLNIEAGPKVDCLDINECDALATSFFNDGFNEYRIIMIPSDTEIDNVEAFINMPCLESLIVSDYPFDSDSQQIEDKYNELTEVLSNYNSYDFDCFIRPSR